MVSMLVVLLIERQTKMLLRNTVIAKIRLAVHWLLLLIDCSSLLELLLSWLVEVLVGGWLLRVLILSLLLLKVRVSLSVLK